MRAWFRRNGLALLALLLLAPVTFATIGFREWHAYFDGRATEPVVVATGERTEFAGAEWGPAAMLPFPMNGVPQDAQLVVTGFAVDAGDEGLNCDYPLLREIGGEHRVWRPSSFSFPLGLEGLDVTGTCRPDRMDRQQVTTLFLLPEDAAGPFSLDVPLVGSGARFVRFTVELSE